MNQTEIKEAIAEQEEYLTRIQSCGGQGTLRSHSFRRQDGRPWSQCSYCGVTETAEDYAAKRASSGGSR